MLQRGVRAFLPFFLLVGVAAAQSIAVSPTSFSINVEPGGAISQQSLVIANSAGPSGSALPYTVVASPPVPWLSLTNASGNTPGTVQFAIDPSSLKAGSYSTSLVVSSPGSSSITVPVNVTATTGLRFTVSPTQLSFTQTVGAALPSSQTVTLGTTGMPLAFQAVAQSAGWLAVDLASGNAPATLKISIVANSLPPGVYSGSISIFGSQAFNNPFIPVTYTISAPPTTLTTAPAGLSFFFQKGQAIPGAQQITATSNGQPLNYTVSTTTTTGGSWLAATPKSGTVSSASPASIAVSVTPGSLAAGTYSGVVSIAAPGASGSPKSVPVTLVISNGAPVLTASPASLSFAFQVGGTNPAAQTIALSSNASLGFSAAASSAPGKWLSVSPATGTTPSTLSVTVDPSNLGAGSYSGNITVTSAGAGNSPLSIPVNLTVTTVPVLSVDQSPISFAYQPGGTVPPAVTINVNSTGAPFAFVALPATSSGGAWLNASVVGASNTPGQVTVSVQPAGLSAGTYFGSVSIAAGAPNSPVTVPVTLTVGANAGLPSLLSSASGFAFAYQSGGSFPAPQTADLTSSDGSPLSYSTVPQTNSGGAAWLSVTPATGTTPSSLTVSVDPTGLKNGTYTGSIQLTAAGVGNSPLTFPVTLTVSNSVLLNASPANLAFASASGSVPPPQIVAVTSTGTPLGYMISATTSSGGNWLTAVSPNGAVTPGQVIVSVNPAGLLPGNYMGTVALASPDAATASAIVTVNLSIGAPPLALSQGALLFTQPSGSQTLTVGSASGTVNFTASANTTSGGNWLAVSPASGNTPGQVAVSVNGAGLAAGVYKGSVIVTGAGGAPQMVPVTLSLTPQGFAVAPSGLTFAYQAGDPIPQPQTFSVSGNASSSYAVEATTAKGGNWLSVSPSGGAIPGTIAVSIDPAGLSSGRYTGTVTVASSSPYDPPQTLNVTLNVSGVIAPVLAAIANAASFVQGAVAPGEIVTLGGTGIGPDTPAGLQLTDAGSVSTLAGATRVLFDEFAAPILYASATQTSVVVPYGIAGRKTTAVQVEYLGARSALLPIAVTAAAPGIFTIAASGSGPGAILNQNASLNSAANPAAKGSVIVIYATGEGLTAPAGVDGEVIGAAALRTPVLPVTVTIGGQRARVNYAGSAPGLVAGVLQVNAVVPATVASGAVPVSIGVGAVTSQSGVTVFVR